jgi:hypothetical protein
MMVGDEVVIVGHARVTSIIPGSHGVEKAEIELIVGAQTLRGEYIGGNWKTVLLLKEQD